MAVLVGIDEAGFGPILGPLVVSSTAFEVPADLLAADLWRILQRSVAPARKHLNGRLLIADSKKAYNRSAGIAHLQRTVLACLRCLGKEPAALTDLLTTLCPDCTDRLRGYPWHQHADRCRIENEGADLAIAAGAFERNLASAKMKLLNLESCCLDVAHYNRMVSAVRNKANVLFSATCRLIRRAFDDLAADEFQVIVDRQGGRIRYRSHLQRMFPDLDLRIIAESPRTSSYELKDGDKMMRLHFTVGADERFLPVSLASMLSKYLRELLVDNINRYFAGFGAELKPTAGYWQDGLRFIRDLRTRLPHIKFDDNQLIRCR